MKIFSLSGAGVPGASYPLWLLFFCLPSGDETETDSEVEDRVDGVKSWLSRNKGSSKTLSDEGSLKSTRLALTSFPIVTDNHVHAHGKVEIKLPTIPALKRP